jgi:hypothetical protein
LYDTLAFLKVDPCHLRGLVCVGHLEEAGGGKKLEGEEYQ